MHPDQLGLLASVGRKMSTGQSAVMLCGWGVKAGWLISLRNEFPFVDTRMGGGQNLKLCDPLLAVLEAGFKTERCTNLRLCLCLYFTARKRRQSMVVKLTDLPPTHTHARSSSVFRAPAHRATVRVRRSATAEQHADSLVRCHCIPVTSQRRAVIGLPDSYYR